MFEDPDVNRFVYILIAAAVILGALWFFVITPLEQRNHERKLAILQEKIRNHEERTGDDSGRPESSGETAN